MSELQSLIIIAIIILILALVATVFMAVRTTHHTRNENARLSDLLRSHEERLSRQEADPAPSPQPGGRPAAVPKTDAELMAWIDSRMDETQLYLRSDLTLKEMATELGLTQKRVAEALRSGESRGSLAEYLTNKRLAHACQLLCHKPYFSIDSVAADSGFRARKTFQTLFKARIGMTPSQYREHCAVNGDGQEAD